MSEPQPSSQSDLERSKEQPETQPRSFIQHLKGRVDPKECVPPLAAYCFMTGFIDAISFSAVFVWCGFQTGNFTQLALALARLFSGPPRDLTFHIADQQALTSLIAFNGGAFIGRLGDKMGPETRIWLFLGTFMQALMTMVAAITIWKSDQGSVAAFRGDPSWTSVETFVGLAFMSASLGLQGIMGKRLNTQFTTTIVLTTVWCELMADPKLFDMRHWVVTRDHKLVAAGSLFIGGFVSRAILDKIGAAGALGVGAGIRLLIALSWLFVPEAPPKKVIKDNQKE